MSYRIIPHHADRPFYRSVALGTRAAPSPDMGWPGLIRHIVETASRFAGIGAAAAFFVIGIIVTWEVVARYVFAAPTRWVEETAAILQIYGVFLACAWLVARREHIRITVVTAHLPRGARAWVGRLSLVAVAAIAGFAAWSASDLMISAVERGERTDSTLEIPMWVLHLPLVVGLALAAVQALTTIWTSFEDPAVITEDHPESEL
jgi:C4-dicarboxylate transporter DctQ subunit